MKLHCLPKRKTALSWSLSIKVKSSLRQHNYRVFSISDVLITLWVSYREAKERHWTIPEIRRTPLKKTKESPKNYPYFSLGIPKKIFTFLSCKGKEDMGIPKLFDCLSYKNGSSQFCLTVFIQKKKKKKKRKEKKRKEKKMEGGFPILSTIFRILNLF